MGEEQEIEIVTAGRMRVGRLGAHRRDHMNAPRGCDDP